MLVPRWILGGILAATLGLTTGLAARSEPLAPPGAAIPDMPLDAATDAQLRTVALVTFTTDLRPLARPIHMIRYPVIVRTGATMRPQARDDVLPAARWDDRGDAALWTRATLSAINSQRHDLSDIVPSDIALWCPAYPRNPERLRDAFWVGMMSALARHESTLNPSAVGGGGLYHGLLQIYPATARNYGCAATTGQGLHVPEDNLACAARIMSATVARDAAVAVYDGRWRGVAADWGPMTNSNKRAEMSAWTREQSYCSLPTGVTVAPRPPARPWTLAQDIGQPVLEDIELAMLSVDARKQRSMR